MFGFIDEVKEKRKAMKELNLANFYSEIRAEINQYEKDKAEGKYRGKKVISLKSCIDNDSENNVNTLSNVLKNQNFDCIYELVNKIPDVEKTSISKENEFYKLTIVTKDGKENSFLVDNGTLMGGTMVSILLNLKNDDFFIPVEKGYEDILIKGLSGNLITEEDVKRVRKNFFPNLALYGAFDFSNTAKIDEIKKSGDNFNKFNNILTTIYMNNLTKTNNVPADMPRMRFTYLKNYNDFEVVSDDKVKPGLNSEYNKTMLKIIQGEKYVVNERGIFHYKDGVCLESTPLNVAPANTEAPIIMNNPQPQYYAMQNPYFQMPVAAM